jgi:radical SAM superfamily enzyme YgiQ (UPF0313 family)
MRILLSNPAAREALTGGRERFYIKAGSRWPWSFAKRPEEPCTAPFPFFLAYAAAVLNQNGFDVHVIDGVALNMGSAEFKSRARAVNPDLMVIETVMNAFEHDLELARSLKEMLPKTRFVFCGPFATVYAERILTEYPFIDFVLLGEYEFTLADLAEKLRDGETDCRLPGVGARTPGGAWVSRERGFIADLNRLPSPAFHLFPANDCPDMARYGDGICTYYPAVTLHSSRGCPFRCDFCLWNQVMYENRAYRVFEPGRVVGEMEYAKETFGAREIYFDDDTFCADKRHVLAVCREVKRRGLKIHWSCMGDAMRTDEEMIAAMADAGCIFMKFGVESGDRRILKELGKPLDPERAVQVSRWCRRYGVMTHATFVFGLYGETLKSMRKTLELANRIQFDYAQASIATPFPGTRLFDKLQLSGAFPDIDFKRFDGTRTCAFNTPWLSAGQVTAFRKRAIFSMVLHKLADPGWWKNFIRRNRILYTEYGVDRVLAPLKALLDL